MTSYFIVSTGNSFTSLLRLLVRSSRGVGSNLCSVEVKRKISRIIAKLHNLVLINYLFTLFTLCFFFGLLCTGIYKSFSSPLIHSLFLCDLLHFVTKGVLDILVTTNIIFLWGKI